MFRPSCGWVPAPSKLVFCSSDGKIDSTACDVLDHRGEEGAEPEGKALNLLVYLLPNLTYGHEIWVVTKSTRLHTQVAKINVLQSVAGLSLREVFWYWWGAWSRVTALIHWKEPAGVVRTSGWDASWMPPLGGLSGTKNWEETLR